MSSKGKNIFVSPSQFVVEGKQQKEFCTKNNAAMEDIHLMWLLWKPEAFYYLQIYVL